MAIEAPIVAEGVPRELDAYLRPVVRILLWVAGVLGSGVLLALGWWWWAPVPLATAVLYFELWSWRRADRPMILTLGPGLRLEDARGGQTLRVDRSDVHAATCWHRARGDGREVALVLYGADRPLLAVAFRVPAYTPRHTDLDADDWDGVLGGMAGIVRASAPPARACRQWFTDPDVLAALHAWVPAKAWDRVAARGWTGTAPALDMFGFHEGPADRYLVFDDATWTDGASSGALEPVALTRDERDAILFRLEGDKPADEAGRLPLLVLGMPGLEIAIPCPAGVAANAGAEGSRVHLHLPEGAAVLAHLRSRSPVARALLPGPPADAAPSPSGGGSDTVSADLGEP